MATVKSFMEQYTDTTTEENTNETKDESSETMKEFNDAMQNDPDFQKLLNPDLLYTVASAQLDALGWSLDEVSPNPEDASEPPMTFKQRGAMILKNNIAAVMEEYELSQSDSDLWTGFYSSESTKDYIQKFGSELTKFVVNTVASFEKNYRQLKENQIQLKIYPGCSNAIMSRMMNDTKISMIIMMVSLIFIERELKDAGFDVIHQKLEQKPFDCVVA